MGQACSDSRICVICGLVCAISSLCLPQCLCCLVHLPRNSRSSPLHDVYHSAHGSSVCPCKDMTQLGRIMNKDSDRVHLMTPINPREWEDGCHNELNTALCFSSLSSVFKNCAVKARDTDDCCGHVELRSLNTVDYKSLYHSGILNGEHSTYVYC